MEKSLFKIASELIELDERMVESGGELTDDIECDLALVTTALVEKTDGVVEYAKYNDSAIKAVSDRIKELTEIKKKLEKKQERFNDYVLICMDKLNTEELNGDIHKIKIRKPVKVVNITNEDLIPIEYIKTETIIKIDKNKLKADLKKGESVHGAELTDGVRKAMFK